MVEDKTSMTYWFPKLEAAVLPVPRTIMVEMDEDARRDVWRVFDGGQMLGDSEEFFRKLREATDTVGYPCFLRTSHTSGKHDWERTCYVTDGVLLRKHVVAIIEYGEMGSIMGLPHNWWAVREFLPTKPITVCQNFGKMPVCKEFRVFVNDDKIQCWHPYWPQHALEQGGALDPAGAFKTLNECHDVAGLHALASRAGAECGGYWSVDILDTERGWVITDMAEGEKSFHWEPCAVHSLSSGDQEKP